MSNEITIFKFEGHEVTPFFNEDGEPLWVLVDICSALGHTNPSQLATRLDPDDCLPVNRAINIHNFQLWSKLRPGLTQSMLVVNEPGLYTAVIRSDCEKATAFTHWIVNKVLPSIRKTGSYSIKPPSELEIARQLVRVLEEKERLEQLIGAQGPDYETVKSAFEKMDLEAPKGQELADFGRYIAFKAREQDILTGKALEGAVAKRGSTATYPKDWLRRTIQELLED